MAERHFALSSRKKASGTHGEAVRGNNALTGGVDVVHEVERPTADVSRAVRILRAISRFGCTPEKIAVELTDDGYRACGNEEAVCAAGVRWGRSQESA